MKSLKRLVPKSAPGVVLAVAVLVSAMGGSAVAGSLVTSRQIKDGTIKSKDLSPALRKKLTRLATPGTPGAKGDTGSAGPAGSGGHDGTNGHDGNDGQPGAPGSAIAYVHILGDGTFDPAQSKNITATSSTGTGLYCIDVTFAVRHMVASPDDYDRAVYGSVGPGGGCPAGTDATVQVTHLNGAIVNSGVYASFN